MMCIILHKYHENYNIRRIIIIGCIFVFTSGMSTLELAMQCQKRFYECFWYVNTWKCFFNKILFFYYEFNIWMAIYLSSENINDSSWKVIPQFAWMIAFGSNAQHSAEWPHSGAVFFILEVQHLLATCSFIFSSLFAVLFIHLYNSND